MDRPELEHLLEQVGAEKAAVERQITVLQARLTALATTAGGVQALLETTPASAGWASAEGSGPGQASVTVASDGARQAPPSPRDIGRKPTPKGKAAAKLILQSDTSRFWSVREVWGEIVRRGWAEPRQQGRKGNPPARIALMRVQEDYPDNVLVTDSPVLSYKWTSTPSTGGSGSAASFAEEA